MTRGWVGFDLDSAIRPRSLPTLSVQSVTFRAVGKTKGKSGRSAKSSSASRARSTPTKTNARAKATVPKSTPARPVAVLPAAPPAPPPPPPPRDELAASRDVGRLLRYGERFGAWKIDTRLLQHMQLPVMSGALAVFDPGAPKSWRVLDRPLGIAAGQFRVMLSVAHHDDGRERLAALVIHVGRPPIAKWTVAHYKGQKKPKSADQLPRCPVTTGWLALLDAGDTAPGVVATPAAAAALTPVEVPLTDGRRALAVPCENGEHVAYWAVDAADKPIALVVDFDVFTQKEWKARSPT
jgi:hypothetical protein